MCIYIYIYIYIEREREREREDEFGGPWFGVNGSEGFYDLDSETQRARSVPFRSSTGY